MEVHDVLSADVQPRQPVILTSRPEGRAVAISLPAGEELSDHEVHERAWLVVLAGEVALDGDGGGHAQTAGAGSLAVFDPQERHAVRAVTDARLLLLLSPWPGEGHPGTRDQPG